MEGHVNTYGGLNKDTAYDSIKPNMYIDAVDIRISTDKGESQGAFTNIKGNKETFTIPKSETDSSKPFGVWSASSPEIIGYTTIRNTIVLFVADNTGTKGWIYEVQYNLATREIDQSAYPKLVYYNENLNFKKEFPIEAIGRYEDSNIQKVYWTDYNNYLRSINIKEPTLVNTPVGLIDSFPDIEFTQPILSAILGSGELNTGMYQIAYRLITFDGKESIISSPSNMIQIATSSEYTSSAQFVGDAEKVNTGKSIVITLDTTQYFNSGTPKFEKVEFFALYYESPIAVPVASFIRTINIASNEIELTYTGTENESFDIELFEFASKNLAFKTFKTITQKDNYLVGANTKSSKISVAELLGPNETFKATTGRYSSKVDTGGNPRTPALPYNSNNGPLANDDYDNAFNHEFNKDRHWHSDWHKPENQFKYKSDGETLGGEGPNISYTFHLERTTLDTDPSSGFANVFQSSTSGGFGYGWDNTHDLNDGYGIRPNPSFSNPSSAFISGLLRGYKRGETYRFGIVFYTKKGEATYVEYIGDIKFPDISEQDKAGTVNGSGTNYFPIAVSVGGFFDLLTGNASIGMSLGIKFNIDFTSCDTTFLENIESYQIVRVPREDIDKRRICQGMLYQLHSASLGSSATHNFDFRIEGSENVVHQHNFRAIEPFQESGFRRLELDSLLYHRDRQGVYDLDSSLLYPHLNTCPKAQHVSFYSAEISNRNNDIIDIVTNPSTKPCYLMTGVYSFERRKENDITNIPIDFQEDGIRDTGVNDTVNAIGPNIERVYDVRHKLLMTQPVTFNSIENCKRIINTAYFDMRDSTNVWIDTKIASWGIPKGAFNQSFVPSAGLAFNQSSYMRNYLAYPGKGSTDKLNDPDHTDNNLAEGSLAVRGGTNISSLMSWFTSDPLDPSITYNGGGVYGSETQADKTQSLLDYFNISGNTTESQWSSSTSVPGPFEGDASDPLIINGYTNNLIQPKRLYPGNAGPNIGTNRSIPLVDIVIPKKVVYGGNTLATLESNKFICASPIIDKTKTSPIVYGGDIFVTMFHWQKAMTEFNSNLNSRYTYGFSHSMIMPVESTINNNLSYGANTTTKVEFTHSEKESPYFRQENNNTKTLFARKDPGSDPARYSLFGYNEIYSQINKDVLFFIKPASTTDLSSTNDIRSFLSAVKVNGEAVDSWSQFGINDFHDVDDHGPINKIINFKNNVYFFQDKATGVYSINREAITTTDDGVPTELGTSQGWGKHQYYSQEIGSMHQYPIAATNNAIYFFDAIHRKIYQLGQGKAGLQTSPLSELKGIHSYLQTLPDGVFARKELGGDNPILLKGAVIGVDEINDEVIFTFLGSEFYGVPVEVDINTTYEVGSVVIVGKANYLMNSTITTSLPLETARTEVLANSTELTPSRLADTSIVFDELANQFSTRLSINPKIWINNGDTLITPNPTKEKEDKVFIHNIGNWGEFYGETKELEITLVINPKADINKVLRFLEFNSIVRDDDKVIDRTKTITGFKISTETQTSGDVYKTSPESLTRLKRRFDKWRIKLPRDNNSTSKKGRFRSTHFLLTLYFDNTYNKELIMNRLVSYYDPQIF